jgi:PIN domain nuclease of toxin-antitoxin system
VALQRWERQGTDLDELKKLDLGESATTFLPRELLANRFEILGIELAHATFVETLPLHHKDPFDRLLIAQGLLETIPIVSVGTSFSILMA